MAEERKYYYTAKAKGGALQQGTITAENLEVATKMVEDKGLVLLSLEEEKKWELSLDRFFNRVKAGDKALFSRQLSTMIGAGYNLTDALKVIASQTQGQYLKEVINEVASDVETGLSLSTAMAKHGDVFNHVYIAVVKAGEASGKLAPVLDELSTELERDYDFSSKLKNAMLYPAFIVVAMVVVGALMMIKVIPQLQSIFAGSKVALPWTTLTIIAVSNFLAKFWWLVLLLVIVIYFLARVYLRSPVGNYYFSKLKLKMPVFGPIVAKSEMTRMTQSFQILTKTGIPLLEAINLAAETMENEIYKRGLRTAAQEVERGVPFSVPLTKNPYFPPMVGQMVLVGEQTGKIDEVFERLAKHFQEETDRELKTLASLIEPVTIVILGLIVAIMVFAIIIPIYNMASAF